MPEKNIKEKFDAQKHLSKDDASDVEYAKRRIKEMQNYRIQKHYGVDLNKLWNEADRDYVPHRLGTANKKIIVTDEEKGWRGSVVRLGESNWQSDISKGNPFVKISTAVSILVDQNPSGTFTPGKKKYQATTELIKQLYQRSWEVAKSKPQLKLFVHNLSKYGWACARTYPLKITRSVKIPVDYNPDDPESTQYNKKEVVEYNDVYRENLDPRNVWIDDMAKPNDDFSIRDWCYRKVYAFDAAEDEFGKYSFWNKFVSSGGITSETIDSRSRNTEQQKEEKNLIEIYFYENRIRDTLIVFANDIPIIVEPLPVSNAQGIKKLSLWQAYWNLRHSSSPYGIGIYEAIRYDNAFLDRIRNMTLDQLTMSIYKMFFYTGTQSLQDTGDIRITPGVGKQVLNPKDITWLEIPGPGIDAYKGLELFKKDVDEASGITDPLMGEITGKTAFEIAQSKEAALKRLKTPLDNILDALNVEGYITIALMEMIYSVPETFQIADQELIEAYINEVGGDPAFYERQSSKENPDGNFIAKVYPEFPIGLEEDDKGNLVESEQTRFFRIKPGKLKWEGIITIRSSSVLAPSKQIEKSLNLEMYNILLPLLAQPPQLYAKAAKNIIKLYELDPKDILPDEWLIDNQQKPLFSPAPQLSQNQPGQLAQTISSGGVQGPQSPTGVASDIIQKMTNPYR